MRQIEWCNALETSCFVALALLETIIKLTENPYDVGYAH